MRTRAALIAMATLCACDSDSPVGTLTGEPQGDPVPASGLWHGTATQNGTTLNDVTCLITESHSLACLFFDPTDGTLAGAANGNVQTTLTGEISGAGTAYAATGYELVDGSGVAEFSFDGGSISASSTLEASEAAIGGVPISVSATYDPLYERDSSVDLVVGTYGTVTLDGEQASLTIDPDGALFSQTSSGCVSEGTVAPIEANHNGYSIVVEVSNCGALDGPYSGPGISLDTNAEADTLVFALFGQGAVLVGSATK